jgi:hypothetical protein
VTRRWRATAVLLTGLALALGAAACGDDEDEGTTPGFEISIPETTATEPATETTTPTQTETTGGSGTGGTSPGGVDPNKEDSATNDKPPPAGSPQEAFEQECERNPAACG